MRKSSIHIEPIKDFSETHNFRRVTPSYAHEELSINNEHWATDNVKDLRKNLEIYYKKKVGQTMKKNASPIREAVINLRPDSTMDELKNLSKLIEEKFGPKCFQIHIHNDEGRAKDDLNYHAHMVFNWTNMETARSFKLNKKDMSELQTVVANTLRMERGVVNSKATRLSSKEYKKEKNNMKILEDEKKNLLQNIENWKEDVKRLEKDLINSEEEIEKIKEETEKNQKNKNKGQNLRN